MQEHDEQPPDVREYIVYACPRGALAEQLARYYAASRAACGPNSAHAYPPHCTLTGFFHDLLAAAPTYAAALAAALARARPAPPAPVLTITDVIFRADFHGLLLDSPWLKALVADFAAAVHSPTRRDALRRKDWLHLSLAYGFAPPQHAALEQLARELVDTRAPVQWELRFYERTPGDGWVAHAAWPLDA